MNLDLLLGEQVEPAFQLCAVQAEAPVMPVPAPPGGHAVIFGGQRRT